MCNEQEKAIPFAMLPEPERDDSIWVRTFSGINSVPILQRTFLYEKESAHCGICKKNKTPSYCRACIDTW
jgi:hypothetical protein